MALRKSAGWDRNKRDQVPVPLKLPKAVRSPAAIVGQSFLLPNPWAIQSSSIVQRGCPNIRKSVEHGLAVWEKLDLVTDRATETWVWWGQ